MGSDCPNSSSLLTFCFCCDVYLKTELRQALYSQYVTQRVYHRVDNQSKTKISEKQKIGFSYTVCKNS